MKARRGDMVIIERQNSFTHARGDNIRTLEFTLEIVASVTREGDIKSTIKRAFHSDMEPEPLFRMSTHRGHKYRDYRIGYRGAYLIPREKVDVDAVWEAWEARTVRDWFPGSFTSLEEAREWLAPYVKG